MRNPVLIIDQFKQTRQFVAYVAVGFHNAHKVPHGENRCFLEAVYVRRTWRLDQAHVTASTTNRTTRRRNLRWVEEAVLE